MNAVPGRDKLMCVSVTLTSVRDFVAASTWTRVIGGLLITLFVMRRDWRAFRERHDVGAWFTPRTFRRTVATLVTDALPAREASDLLGHSRVSQTTDTYVGRMAVSRRPADVLDALGGPNGGSKGARDESESSE